MRLILNIARIFGLIILPNILMAQNVLVQKEGIYDLRTNKLYEDQTPPSLSLFENRSTLKAEIYTDQERLSFSIDDPRNQDATLVLFPDDTTKIVKSIKIRVRGNTRRTLCDIPPLRLDLNETEFLNDWFGNITSLKLVNPCFPDEKAQQYLHKEYIIYEMYGALTEKSYQVKMLNLSLLDSQNGDRVYSGLSFAIENDKNLAARTGLSETELEDTNVAEIVNTFYLYPNTETLYNATLASIFQYMIGNPDWHITKLHNVKMFGREEIEYVIPYDFDYSGFVNASYATPSSNLPIKKVRDRYYLGPCSDPLIVEKALDTVLANKEIFYQKIKYNPYIGKRVKQSLISYLDQFFKESSDKQEFINKLSEFNCQYRG